jgi:tetratricopeptide (TPR) repeat protein
MSAASSFKVRAAALLFALACGVYAGSLRNGFTYDDVFVVAANPAVTGEGGPGRIFSSAWWTPDDSNPLLHAHLYRPVTILTFRAQQRLAGAAPWHHHLVNVLLHGAVTSLLLLLFLRLSQSPGTAAAGALLFAVHPIHSEAVVSVVGRAELLAALFVTAAWLLRERPAAATALFALGLLSKESAIALPGLILAEEAALRLRGMASGLERWRRLAVLLSLMAVVVLLVLLVRAAVLGTPIGEPGGPFEGAPATHRLLTAVDVLGRYLQLMVFPVTLSADYSFDQIPMVTAPGDARFLKGVAAAASCAVLAWWSARRVPAAALGIALFFVSLLPVSNILFGIGTVMAERLLYVPSAGLCLAAGALIERAARAALPAASPRRLLATACLLAAIPAAPFALRCWTRTADWRDQRTLFETTVRTSPRSALAWLGLGNAYEDEGLFREAEAAYRRAVEIAPALAVGRFNLGNMLRRLGRPAEAILEFERALLLRPTLWQACAELEPLYRRAGRPGEADEAARCKTARDAGPAK